MFAAESTDVLCESADEVEGCESNAVQSATRMTCATAADVIAQDRAEDIEATVLNVPAATRVFQQKGRIGCGTRQAGNRIGGAAASLAVLDGLAFQSRYCSSMVAVVVVTIRISRRPRFFSMVVAVCC